MQLNADMLVLSGCEFGLGDRLRGEGIMTFMGGFAYAEAKSIISSLWCLNDRTSVDLIKDFYQNLLLGKNKAEALRSAQLRAIRKGKTPYFWAGFAPYGDMKAINNRHSFLWPVILLITFCVLLFIYYLIKPLKKFLNKKYSHEFTR